MELEIKQTPPSALTPDAKLRKHIEQTVHADSHMCWTCRSCSNECPLNLATGLLQTVKIVRMATFGLLNDLLKAPEIWYCQQCRRCNQICPMKVKPADIIAYARNEIIRRKWFPHATIQRYYQLYGKFQRARWHMVYRCFNEETPILSKTQWYQWLNDDTVPSSQDVIVLKSRIPIIFSAKNISCDSQLASCFNCGECNSACLIFYERSVFDPRWIFRMANLGLIEELLKSPAIWLCVGCQRCTNACSQLVKGHLIIERLKKLAVSEGFVDDKFPYAWKESHKSLYPHLIDEIDSLFGF